jgi:hypothetical protein
MFMRIVRSVLVSSIINYKPIKHAVPNVKCVSFKGVLQMEIFCMGIIYMIYVIFLTVSYKLTYVSSILFLLLVNGLGNF